LSFACCLLLPGYHKSFRVSFELFLVHFVTVTAAVFVVVAAILVAAAADFSVFFSSVVFNIQVHTLNLILM